MSSFALVHIGQLATFGQLGLELTKDGAVWVEGANVRWTGPTDELPPDSGRQDMDLRGRLVTPGLIDAHTHTVFDGNRFDEFEWRCEGRTYQQIAAQGGGIRSSMRATRDASDETLVRCAARHLRSLIQCGTTAVETKSGYGLSCHHELRSLLAAEAAWASLPMPAENLSLTFLGAHAVPPEFEGDAQGHIRHLIEDGLPHLPESVTSADAFVESGYFSQEVVEPYLRAAQARGLKLRLHVDQLEDSGGAAFAARMGAQSADHLEHTPIEGIRALQAAGVFPVLLPGSVLGLGSSQYPQARAMLEAGLRVVLATDFNPGSSPVRSLPAVMGLGCRMMRMTPAEALAACTVSAAASLGWEHRMGRICEGYQADIVAWEAEDYRELAYWTPPPTPNRVWVKGSDATHLLTNA